MLPHVAISSAPAPTERDIGPSDPSIRLAARHVDSGNGSRCRVCGSSRLELVVDLGAVPLANAFRAASDVGEEDLYPLGVTFCHSCTMVQLIHLVDPEVLFRRYVYTPGASVTWRMHCTKLSEWLRARVTAPAPFVVEPASNDGTLLREISQWAGRVLGVDPAENIARMASDAGIETLPEFFSEGFAQALAASYGPADVVIGTNVLAHVPDIVDFIKGARQLLSPDGLLVVEAPYLPDLVSATAYDSIYHEHVSYLSVSSLARVMTMGGMTLTHVERTPVHGGSIRFVAQKLGQPADATVLTFLEEEARLGYRDGTALRRFSDAVNAIRGALRGVVQSLTNEGKRLAAYGATAKGTILLNTAGLGRHEIRYIVDKSLLKQGLVAPGTRIPVVPPATIYDDPVDVLVLLAWNLKDEIIAQESAFAARGGRFLIPIPFPAIL
jgi:hypothetical protein